jgi:hypothetical protein
MSEFDQYQEEEYYDTREPSPDIEDIGELYEKVSKNYYEDVLGNLLNSNILSLDDHDNFIMPYIFNCSRELFYKYINSLKSRGIDLMNITKKKYGEISIACIMLSFITITAHDWANFDYRDLKDITGSAINYDNIEAIQDELIRMSNYNPCPSLWIKEPDDPFLTQDIPTHLSPRKLWYGKRGLKSKKNKKRGKKSKKK